MRNKSVKSSLKTVIRKLNEASAAGNTETATALLRDASRQLDKAVSKGVIHKNQAANRKSAIAKRIASLSACPRTSPRAHAAAPGSAAIDTAPPSTQLRHRHSSAIDRY